MKKFLMIFICAIMVFGITGCGSSKREGKIDKKEENTEEKKSNIEEKGENKEVKNSFATDDWETIVKNIKSGKTYKVGDTKEIDMGTLGKHTIRVANNSTPKECSEKDFSQTACGFVLEFADAVTKHRINPALNQNASGRKYIWEDTEMRAYVNNDIYNALPSELKNIIIDTTVVSGHGPNDSANSITTDKLYLLSTMEVWGAPYFDTVTEKLTRQLDYYKDLGVTQTNYSKAIKKIDNNNIFWWLRSVYSRLHGAFNAVNVAGGPAYNAASYSANVSPAFRIG